MSFNSFIALTTDVTLTSTVGQIFISGDIDADGNRIDLDGTGGVNINDINSGDVVDVTGAFFTGAEYDLDILTVDVTGLVQYDQLEAGGLVDIQAGSLENNQTEADSFTVVTTGTQDHFFTDIVFFADLTGTAILFDDELIVGTTLTVDSTTFTANSDVTATDMDMTSTGLQEYNGDVNGGGDSIFIGGEIDFLGGVDTVTGTTITLQPATASQAVVVGGAADSGAPLDITLTDLAAMGIFNSITIGRTDGDGAVTVNTVTFDSDVTIQSPQVGGSITVSGALNTTNQSELILDATDGSVNLNANLTTDGGNVTVNGPVVLGADVVVDTNDVTDGVVSFSDTIDGTAGGADEGLTLDIGISSITFNSAVGGLVALEFLTISNAGNVNLETVNLVGALTQVDGSGTTTFNDVATVNSASIATDAIAFSGNARIDSTLAVSLTAQLGTVTGGTASVDVSATDLTVNVVSGLGTLINPFQISADTLNLNSSTSGDVHISESNELILQDIDVVDGTFNFSSGGGIQVVDVLVTGAGNDVNLTADTADINLGVINAPDTINLEATNGSVVDDNGATNNLTASGASFISDTGIGTLINPIETVLSNLEASTNTGGVFIDNTGSLIIGGVGGLDGVDAGTGDVEINSTADLTVDENVSGDVITLQVANNLNINVGINVTGNLFLESTAGNINAGSNNFTSIGSLSLIANSLGGNVTAGSLTGNGITVTANDTITLSSTLDAQGGFVNLTATTLNATTSGLDIQDSNSVDLNIGTTNVNGGDYTINNAITGTIDLTGSTAVNVVGANNFTAQTSGAGGITYGNVDVNAGNINLTTTAGSVQQGVGGSLSVNANGGDIALNTSAALTLGAGGVLLGGTSADIDLTANSTAGLVTITGAQNLNSLTSTGQTGVVISGTQTTDTGNISVTATTGNINAGNNNLVGAGSVIVNANSAGSDVTLGSLTGNGITVSANNEINLSSILDAEGGAVALTATTLNATASGLDIQDSNSVDLNIGTTNVNGGSFTVNNSVTGTIDATGSTTINVLGTNDLNWNTSGAGGITYGNADLNAANIILTASAGSITQTATGTLEVDGDGGDVTLTQAGSITIGAGGIGFGGNIADIDLGVFSTGGVVTYLSTSVWNALITTGQNGIVLSGGQSADNGNINIAATNGAIAGGANNLVATGSVTVTAIDGTAAADITLGSMTGSSVTVNATDTITLSSTIDAEGGAVALTATTLNANTNGLDIQDSNSVDLNISGTLNVDGGDFTANNAVTGTIDATGTGTVNVQGANSLNWSTSGAGGISYGNADLNASSITLNTTNVGATISQGVGGSLAVNADGGDVLLNQTPDFTIGTGGVLLGGTITHIDLSGTSAGQITIADGFNLNSLAVTGGTGVVVSNSQTADNGVITLQATTGNIAAGTNTLTATGAVTVTANAGGANVIIGSLTGTGVTLQANDTITLASTIDAEGAGVTLTATTLNANTNGLDIQDSNSVDLNVSGTLNVDGGNFTTNNTITGTIDATGTGTINVQGANTLDWSTTGVGGIEYGTADLNAANINLTATNAGIEQTAGGSLAVNADGGDITLNQMGALTIGTGGVLFGGTVSDVDLTANATNGVITYASAETWNSLTSTSEGGMNVNAAQATDTGNIDLTSNNGALNATEVDASVPGADIMLTTTGSGDVNVDIVNTTGNVTITSAERIEEIGTDGTVDITANVLVLTAATAIGNPGALETAVNVLTATTTTGNIAINQTGAVDIQNINTGAGNVTFNGAGDITVTTITATGGSFDVSATDGSSIIDNNGAANNFTANGNSTLTATGALGTISGGLVGGAATSVDVNVIGGSLTVFAPGVNAAGISVNVNGTVTPTNTLALSLPYGGEVYFNGILLFPLPVASSSVLPPFALSEDILAGLFTALESFENDGIPFGKSLIDLDAWFEDLLLQGDQALQLLSSPLNLISILGLGEGDFFKLENVGRYGALADSLLAEKILVDSDTGFIEGGDFMQFTFDLSLLFSDDQQKDLDLTISYTMNFGASSLTAKDQKGSGLNFSDIVKVKNYNKFGLFANNLIVENMLHKLDRRLRLASSLFKTPDDKYFIVKHIFEYNPSAGTYDFNFYFEQINGTPEASSKA